MSNFDDLFRQLRQLDNTQNDLDAEIDKLHKDIDDFNKRHEERMSKLRESIDRLNSISETVDRINEENKKTINEIDAIIASL